VGLVEVITGAIASVTLHRAEARNALSIELCDDIRAAFEELRNDGEVRVVILKGAGQVFCSGADLAAVAGPQAASFLPSFEGMLETVRHCPHPTVAAIQGAALGGGFQLATVCDFRLAATDSKIGIPSTKLGIVVNFENVERLVLLVGTAVAKEVLMTGRVYGGDDAAAVGLVTRAVAAGSLDDAVQELAERISALAPLSVRAAKTAIEIVTDQLSAARATAAALVEEVDSLVTGAYASSDLQEGLKAMAEKRPPRFEGR
jgi:enoyl-CoA hydratase/carnithine racemase